MNYKLIIRRKALSNGLFIRKGNDKIQEAIREEFRKLWSEKSWQELLELVAHHEPEYLESVRDAVKAEQSQ